MRRLRISIVAISVILAMTVGSGTALAGSRVTDPDRHQMLKATNSSRLTHRVARLSLNDRLSAIARHHSEEMASRGYLFHTSNVNTYLSGISWHAWGENVGYTQGGTVNELEQAFMHSPVHRENILNRSFRHVAIGTFTKNGVMWVTVFFYG